jgi:hypothetical protein
MVSAAARLECLVLTQSVSALQASLRELEEEFDDKTSLLRRATTQQQHNLHDILEPCRSDLETIGSLITEHRSLRTSTPRFRDKWSFDTGKQAEIKERIRRHSDKLNLYLTQLHTTSLARIEKYGERHTKDLAGIRADLKHLRARFDYVCCEVRTGRKNPSLLTNVRQWSEFEKELVDDDITEVDVEVNKVTIHRWLAELQANASEVVPESKKDDSHTPTEESDPESPRAISSAEEPDNDAGRDNERSSSCTDISDGISTTSHESTKVVTREANSHRHVDYDRHVSRPKGREVADRTLITSNTEGIRRNPAGPKHVRCSNPALLAVEERLNLQVSAKPVSWQVAELDRSKMARAPPSPTYLATGTPSSSKKREMTFNVLHAYPCQTRRSAGRKWNIMSEISPKNPKSGREYPVCLRQELSPATAGKTKNSTKPSAFASPPPQTSYRQLQSPSLPSAPLAIPPGIRPTISLIPPPLPRSASIRYNAPGEVDTSLLIALDIDPRVHIGSVTQSLPATLEELYHGFEEAVLIRRTKYNSNTGEPSVHEDVVYVKVERGTLPGAEISVEIGPDLPAVVFIVLQVCILSFIPSRETNRVLASQSVYPASW